MDNKSDNPPSDPPAYDGSQSTHQPQTFNPPNVPLPPPSYSQVCITPLHPTSKLITIAGQNGYSPTNPQHIPLDLPAQARQAYQNLLNCLKATGASPRDIVFVRHYIVDGEHVAYRGAKTEDWAATKRDVVDRGWAPIWCEFMDREAGGHRPPDTVLGVAGLARPKMVYEVEVQVIRHFP